MLNPTHERAAGRRMPVPRIRGAASERALAAMWSNRWVGRGVAAGLSALAALILSFLMPRGPVTTGEALSLMGVGLAVGLIAGLATRSRWSMLIAPVAFVAVFELTWLGVSGPTVDGIHPGSIYGIVALVSGRGLFAVLGIVPMLLGVSFGVAAAGRREPGAADQPMGKRRIGLNARRGVVAVVSLAVVALAVFIARPPTTDPILGADGLLLAGSVAELATVPIGGHDQSIMIRGNSVESPVLLFLAGGPGGSDVGSMRNLGSALEANFVVASWDQRGAGKSMAALEPTSTLTVEQVVADTISVTNYLRERFDEQKVYLVGNSWGTLIGVLAAQENPELFHAFVGTGQMVSPLETDKMFYADTLAWAERTDNAGLTETLRANGPPPYDDVRQYEPALSNEHGWNVYPEVEGFMAKGEMPGNILVEEFSLMEKLRTMGAFLDSFSVLYPQLGEMDFRQDVPSLEIPVYLVQGRHEARGRAGLAREWFSTLDAPTKQLTVFERSGHKPLFEEPERFHSVMTDTVLAETYPAAR